MFTRNRDICIVVLCCILLSWCGDSIASQSVKDDLNILSKKSATVLNLSCGLVKKNGRDLTEEAYSGCGLGVKTCYGDKEGCVEKKSCSHMSTLSLTDSDVSVQFYSKCGLEDRPGRWGDYYFGAAVNETIEVEGTGDNRRVICKTPQREDFKLFHFWPKRQLKCNPQSENYFVETITSVPKSLASIVESCNAKYEDYTGIIDVPASFRLRHYIANYELVHSSTGSFEGKTPVIIEGMVDYVMIDSVSCISTPYEEEIEATTIEPPPGGSTTNHITYALIPISIIWTIKNIFQNSHF